MGRLYFGDNIDVLRNHVRDESVDLIYLDPPFNSNANYNVLFNEPSGMGAQAQAEMFRDTWEWGEQAELAYDDVLAERGDVAILLRSLRSWMGENAMMAYLAMMTVRLVEMRRKLKPKGSLFLHCDPKASHYLKIILDAIFGHENFRNEIVWKRTSGHSDARRFGSVHDTILFYSFDADNTWNKVFQKYDQAYVEQYYRYEDDNGRKFMSGDLSAAGLQGGGYDYVWKGVRRVWRVPLETMKRLDVEGRVFYTRNGIPRMKRYLDESDGLPAQDIWTDVEPLRSWHRERLGYPTQKPVALLERIITAASNPGDLVLDPFCGCGTTVEAAENLADKREWIGIDVTHYAVTLIEARLKANHPLAQCDVQGRPRDLEGARELARRDKHQFQWWAAWRLGSQTYREERRGPDRGIDGNIYFKNGPYGDGRIIVSVKGGASAGVDVVRELRAVVDRESAEMGVLISLAEPTRAALNEASAAGFLSRSAHGRMPRLQCVTVEQLLSGDMPHLPPLPQPQRAARPTARRRKSDPAQVELLLPFAGEQIGPQSGSIIDPRFMQLGA